MMAKCAFLGGLGGVMGYPMAGHLVKAGGHEVVVYNRSFAKAEAWAAEHGGSAHRTPPREAAEGGAEFIMICVGNDDDLRSVCTGPDGGAFAGMGGQGAVVVDHTTVSAAVTEELAVQATAQGGQFVDAPISGGQAGGAENGVLAIMCGGGIRPPSTRLNR